MSEDLDDSEVLVPAKPPAPPPKQEVKVEEPEPKPKPEKKKVKTPGIEYPNKWPMYREIKRAKWVFIFGAIFALYFFHSAKQEKAYMKFLNDHEKVEIIQLGDKVDQEKRKKESLTKVIYRLQKRKFRTTITLNKLEKIKEESKSFGGDKFFAFAHIKNPTKIFLPSYFPAMTAKSKFKFWVYLTLGLVASYFLVHSSIVLRKKWKEYRLYDPSIDDLDEELKEKAQAQKQVASASENSEGGEDGAKKKRKKKKKKAEEGAQSEENHDAA